MDSLRIAIMHLIQYKNIDDNKYDSGITKDYVDGYNTAINDILDRLQSNEANHDTLLECMLEMNSSCSDTGHFKIFNQEIPVKDMIVHLECDDDIGHQFRKDFNNMMIAFFLKFRG